MARHNRKYSTSFTSIDGAASAAVDSVRVCPECCGYYSPWRIDQIRCSKRCNRTYWARQQKRGPVLMPMAMAWRTSRGKKKDMMMAMCKMLDDWHFDDKTREAKYEEAVAALTKRRTS